MQAIKAIFFWMGGVIIQPIPELVVKELYDQPIEYIDFQNRLYLRELAQQLYIGQIDGRAYCLMAVQQCQSALEAKDLETKIIHGASLQPLILEIVDSLPTTYQRWLISDYPPEWFRPIAQRLDLFSRFQEDRIIFTSTCGLTRLVPDIFYHVVHQSNQSLKDCVIIDSVTPRAIQAVRHGLSSTIFVDAKRLKKDFSLRKMLA
jgi:FMN phosphatase YigB (HAD superfamily)